MLISALFFLSDHGTSRQARVTRNHVSVLCNVCIIDGPSAEYGSFVDSDDAVDRVTQVDACHETDGKAPPVVIQLDRQRTASQPA